MAHSPRMRTALILRRMGYNRLLLGCVLVAVVVITAVVAGLANFSARTLPAAAQHQLTAAQGTTISMSATGTPAQAAAANRLISTSLRGAFGTVPFALRRAMWSDPLTLPSPPTGDSIWTADVAVMDGFKSQAHLVAGRWPLAAQHGRRVEVAIPAADAGPLGMRIGQRLKLSDSQDGNPAALIVTGLYRPANARSPYWGLDLLPASGVSIVPGFQTFGPFVAQPGAFGTGQLTEGQQSWLAEPKLAAVRSAQMAGLARRLQNAVDDMRSAQNLGGLQVTTNLPQILAGTATSYEVARSLLAMTGLELLLVAAAALALAAALLASQRGEESALMAARGVTRRQIAVLALAEAILLLAIATIAGGAIGYWLAGPLASAGQLQINLGHLASPGSALWWPALLVLAMAALILAWPAVVPGGTSGLLGSRRRPVLAVATRAGADLAILTLAIVSASQLRRYSVVARSASGSIGIDPVLIAAPALILLGAALIPLRVVPALTRLGDRLSARGSRLVGALATWEIARRPVRQAGPALLAILAVGTGTLALAQQQSWHESVVAQAAATAGADVRINVSPPATLPHPVPVLTGRDVTAAMPVSQFDGGLGGQIVAIDASQAAKVVLLRSDQIDRPAPALWRTITPTSRALGLAVPGRPARISTIARLTQPAGEHLALSVTLSVQATNGVAYALPAGTLAADGRSHSVTATVPEAARASYPLRVLGILATYQMAMPPSSSHAMIPRAVQPVTLTIAGMASSARSTGHTTLFASGAALAGWGRQATSSTLATNNMASGKQPALVSWQSVGRHAMKLSFLPGYGQLIPGQQTPPPLPIPIAATLTIAARQAAGPVPGIATTSFLSSTTNHVGGKAIVAVGSYHVSVTIVAAIKSFPTAGPGGALIVDQRTLQALLAAQSGPPLPVTSWWLSTASGRLTPPGVPMAQVTNFRQLQTAMLNNPVAAAPQRAVRTLIVAVELLAILGFAVSVAASVSERRARSALLSALGVSRVAKPGSFASSRHSWVYQRPPRD